MDQGPPSYDKHHKRDGRLYRWLEVRGIESEYDKLARQDIDLEILMGMSQDSLVKTGLTIGNAKRIVNDTHNNTPGPSSPRQNGDIQGYGFISMGNQPQIHPGYASTPVNNQPQPQSYPASPTSMNSNSNANTTSVVVNMGQSQDKKANHCCHFLLCFFSGGLWAPCWLGACCGCCCLRPCNS